MLLMGRKYEIASFTTLAEGILVQLFPPTLEQWDACQEEIKNITTRDHRFLFDLFNLVYEFPLPSILRPLLISMCTIFNLVCHASPSHLILRMTSHLFFFEGRNQGVCFDTGISGP